MSKAPSTPGKKKPTCNISKTCSSNNQNAPNKLSDHMSARNFAYWYKKMMDYERNNIGPYLAEEVVFHGFGRKISTRKKVVGYLKYVMDHTSHDFTSIRIKEKITEDHEFSRFVMLLFIYNAVI